METRRSHYIPSCHSLWPFSHFVPHSDHYGITFPIPSDVNSLQNLMGMLNFYRCFLPGIARILKLLTDATPGTGKLLNSFDQAKALLASAVPLHHSNPSATLSLATDASDTHVGAVLQQFSNGCW
jgi:hypothetical protein